MSPPRDLRRRNALWQCLRTERPGTPVFEDALRELSTWTGWNRARVLAGLGLTDTDVPPPQEEP